MRITEDMIDPELRSLARKWRIVQLFTSKTLFRLIDVGYSKMAERLKRETAGDYRCEERWISRSGDNSKLRVCIFGPKEQKEPLPVFVYFHGGGFIMGNPEVSLDIFRQFIETRECIFVSPAYRKSLEAPYPAAFDDCYDTLLWARDHAKELGGRPDQIIVGGHSAGGGLTAAVSLRARERGDVKIGLQLPIYPMLDDRNDSESARDNNGAVWDQKANGLAWGFYLKGLEAEPPMEAAPARATSYAGFPPAIAFVGDLDPVCSETTQYVENLRAAGVPVEFEVYEGGFHGFELMVPDAAISRKANNFVYDAFAEGVDRLIEDDTVIEEASAVRTK